MITKEQLLEFGMIETVGDEKIIYPMTKVISLPNEDEEELEYGEMSIVVSNLYNTPQLALSLPDGDIIYLAVSTIKELKAFEKCIARWEPAY